MQPLLTATINYALKPAMRYLLVFLALTIIFPPNAQAQQAAPDSAQVVETVERFRAALTAGDSATVAALLLPDAVILEGGGLETKEEYFGHHFGADAAFLAGMDREIEDRQVRVEEDAAWVSTTSRMQGTYDEQALDLQSAELMVLRRTPQGWRIAAIHWSSRSRE